METEITAMTTTNVHIVNSVNSVNLHGYHMIQHREISSGIIWVCSVFLSQDFPVSRSFVPNSILEIKSSKYWLIVLRWLEKQSILQSKLPTLDIRAICTNVDKPNYQVKQSVAIHWCSRFEQDKIFYLWDRQLEHFHHSMRFYLSGSMRRNERKYLKTRCLQCCLWCLWLFHHYGQLNSTTTTLSLHLLKGRGGENTMEKGSKVETRTGRSQNRLSEGILI